LRSAKECIAKSGKYVEDGDFAGEIHTLDGGFMELGSLTAQERMRTW